MQAQEVQRRRGEVEPKIPHPIMKIKCTPAALTKSGQRNVSRSDNRGSLRADAAAQSLHALNLALHPKMLCFAVTCLDKLARAHVIAWSVAVNQHAGISASGADKIRASTNPLVHGYCLLEVSL